MKKITTILCMMVSVLSMAQEEQDSWWQSDGSLRIENAEHTFRSPIVAAKGNIQESEMVLIDLNAYLGKKQNNIDYGIYSKDLGSGESTKLKVYHRRKIDGSNPNNAPLFGYDFQDNDYLIYGCETFSQNVSSFTKQQKSWDADGFYSHGWSFSETQIKSTDYTHLWNRPKSATWWDTIYDVFIGVIILITVLATIILTAGAGAAIIAAIAESTIAVLTPATIGLVLATSGLGILSLTAIYGREGHLFDQAEHRGSEFIIPQTEFSTNMELPIPGRFLNPSTDTERNWNKSIDIYLVGAIDCTDIPDTKCYRAPFREVVVEMQVKNAHIKNVNIPGEIRKDLTPYQLFKNYQYLTDQTGTVNVNVPPIEASTIFDSKEQILPRKLLYASYATTTNIVLENYTGIPTYYMVAKDVPDMDALFYVDLGVYGVKDGDEYRLYRYQTNVNTESFSFETGPEGPFLIGDNLIVEESPVVVTVTKPDGDVRGTYYFNSMTAELETVECIMGDRVEFTVTSPNSDLPTITGLPATWLAPMGREYYYHCDPSIVPGGIKPKVPFDVQSHYVASNDAMVENYPDWIQDSSNPNSYTLTWMAQRRTAVPTTEGNGYNAQYKFTKAAMLGGKLQRKSKSEGQIMDFLEIYNKNKFLGENSFGDENGFRYNPSEKTYYWNIDSDELIYFNTKDYDTNTPGWSGKVKRVPLYDVATANDPYSAASLGSLNKVSTAIGTLYEPWQLVREGDYLWDADDGYPKSGFAINSLVDAYWQHYDATTPLYRGYEIEDFCLYKDADGVCIGGEDIINPAIVGEGAVYNRGSTATDDNNKHPGLIQISNGSLEIAVPIKVDAPLSVDHGFYGNVITPAYSSVKADIPLSVVGLPVGMDADSQARYSLRLRSYSLQDFPEDTYKLGIDGTYDSELGSWTLTKQEIGFEQAWSATLYFTAEPSNPSTEVIIGGAEWKNTNISYVFTTKDAYGGEACTGCLDLKAGYEEFADNYVQSNRYSYDFSQGHIQSFDGETFWEKTLRSYVLDVNDKNTRFVCMDALDNIWDMHGNAYYWGYRALAKQITDELLANSLTYTLTNVTSGEEVESNGRFFDFAPSLHGVGEYTLQVKSRIGGDASPNVGIKVTEFYEEGEGIIAHTPEKGNIYTRELFAKEKTILGLVDDGNLADYKVAYVDEVLSTYKYVDGYRADKHDDSKNRFAKYNDYREDYEWTTLEHANSSNPGPEVVVPNISSVQTAINDFDPTSYWKPEWNNWLRHYSYGKFPNSVVSASEDQVLDTDYRNEISQLFDNSSFQINEFLRTLIWLAPTDYDGYRINGLMKTIVNLDEFFNNHAFSGNVSPAKRAKLPVFLTKEQDLTDDEKYGLHLLRKLKNGEMIIYDASNINNLSVYQKKDPTTTTFVASTNSPNGIPLTIGQDLRTIQDYGSTTESDGSRSFPIPVAVTTYLNLYALLNGNNDPDHENGCDTNLKDFYGGLGEDPNGNLVTAYYNKGGGPINTRQLADTYPNSDLNIGLLFTTIITTCDDGTQSVLKDLKDIPQGAYNNEIDRLITFCKSRTEQTIYLRPGYEFDLIWNIGYQDTDAYKAAFTHIVDRFRTQNVNNVKFVWQGAVSPFNHVDYLAYVDNLTGARDLFGDRIPHDPLMLEDWYPGTDYVDIIGLSYFENPDSKGTVAVSTFGERVKTQRELADALLGIARRDNKPVMVAEITPRGYDIDNLTKSNTHKYWDGPIYTTWDDDDPSKRVKEGTVAVTAEQIWDDFYQPLFDYVETNGDVIKYFCYIDANWTSVGLQWQWTNEFQYWGDARVEANTVIKRKWQNEINKPKWIHGSALHAPAPADLTIYDITPTSVKFSSPKNDQPNIATFRFVVKCTETRERTQCPVLTLDYNAPQWADGDFALFENLTPSTSYTVTLEFIDYFGNSVGSLEKLFTTTSDASGRKAAISPKGSDINIYSNPIIRKAVKSSKVSDINIYPNPTSGELNITFGLEQASTVRIELIDINGRVLFSISEFRDSGNHTLRFDNLRNNISLPSTSLVLVKVTTNESQAVKKIIIIE